MSRLFVYFIFCSLLIGCKNQTYFSYIEEVDPYPRFVMLVLLSSEDCIVCSTEIDIYNKIEKEISASNIQVIGILKDDYYSELPRQNIDFDVFINKRIFKRYSTDNTPEGILIDVKTNEIVYRTIKKKSISSQEATFQIIDLIIRNIQ